MFHFKLFLSPGMQKPLGLSNNIMFYIGQLKKNTWGIDPRKDKSSRPFSTVRLFYFFTNLRQAERCLAD